MKIRLLTTYASPSGLTGQPGSVINVPEAEAAGLIAGNYGLAVETASPAATLQDEPRRSAESAEAGPPENTAATPGASPRRPAPTTPRARKNPAGI